MRISEYEYASLLNRRSKDKSRLEQPAIILNAKSRQLASQKSRSSLEIEFESQLVAFGIFCQKEYRPIHGRQWRIDFAWPEMMAGVEVDGAVHRIKSRFHGDLEKNAALLLAGWRILHVGREQIHNGTALEWVQRLLRNGN